MLLLQLTLIPLQHKEVLQRKREHQVIAQVFNCLDERMLILDREVPEWHLIFRNVARVWER